MKFRIHQHKDLGLTIHEAIEQIDIEDIMSVLEDFYQSRLTTYLIWDLYRGGNPKLSRSDMQRIIDYSKRRGSLREGGKSAIVTDVDLYFGISRMFETHSGMADGLSLKFSVFRNYEEAMAWLGLDPGDGWEPW